MCRLFGLNAGANRVHVAYWLVDAPDSMSVESSRNPDGTGIGWFDDAGTGHVAKWADEAAMDAAFGADAKTTVSDTVVTHVRAATAGRRRVVNCHPFLIDNRVMAHNGGFGDVAAVEAELGTDLTLVHGDTDSERYAALIAQRTRQHDGSVAAGLASAARWLSANVPMYSLNTIVAESGHLWALRYPDQRALHVATREIRAATGGPWAGAGTASAHEVRPVTDEPVRVVVVASERIDESEDWRMLAPGELIHVGPDLQMRSEIVLHDPPAHCQVPSERDPNFDDF